MGSIFRPVWKSIRYNVNSAQGNRTRPDRYVVELFTPYRIDVLRVCFDLAKEIYTRVQDNDNEIPFQKSGRSAEQPVHIKSGAFQKAIRCGTYHFWNQSVPDHNRPKSRAGPVGSNVNRRAIRYGFRALR